MSPISKISLCQHYVSLRRQRHRSWNLQVLKYLKARPIEIHYKINNCSWRKMIWHKGVPYFLALPASTEKKIRLLMWNNGGRYHTIRSPRNEKTVDGIITISFRWDFVRFNQEHSSFNFETSKVLDIFRWATEGCKLRFSWGQCGDRWFLSTKVIILPHQVNA